jgi:hypothetical protein
MNRLPSERTIETDSKITIDNTPGPTKNISLRDRIHYLDIGLNPCVLCPAKKRLMVEAESESASPMCILCESAFLLLSIATMAKISFYRKVEEAPLG